MYQSILSPAALERWRALEAEFAAMTDAEREEFTAGLEQLRKQTRRPVPDDHPEQPAVPIVLQKVCPKCGIVRPIWRFKKRSRRQGQRESWCLECVNAADRERRARKRAGVVRGLGRQIRVGTPAEKTRAVVAVTVQRFGGAAAVGRELAEAFQRTRSRRDKLSILRTVFRVLQSAE